MVTWRCSWDAATQHVEHRRGDVTEPHVDLARPARVEHLDSLANPRATPLGIAARSGDNVAPAATSATPAQG